MEISLKKLLKNMTTEEKIGQLVQLTASFFINNKTEITGPIEAMGLTPEDLPRVGSTLGTLGAADMIKIQKEHLEQDRNKIPMVFMRDVIHGFRTIYPAPIGMGCCFDPALMEECTRMTAEEASAGGVQVTFTPMVDYVRDARWGRVMETYSEDPYLTGVLGAAQVRAFQGDDISKPGNLATCVKHFAAYGGAEAGRDYNTVELSEHILREFYLPAYKACIDAGAKMIMPSFNNLNGIPSTANPWLMQTVLRKEWGFKGLVISDYGAVNELRRHGVAADLKEAAEMVFKNGCDIEMMSSAYHKHLKELIQEGRITMRQLDRVVMKVLKFKKELGLFEDPYHGASVEKEAELYLSPKNREIVRRAAEESSVLLKNEGVLPFDKNVKEIALIGPFGTYNGLIGGWAGSGRCDECVTVKTGLEELLPHARINVVEGCGMYLEDTDTGAFSAAVSAAQQADIVILCLGEPLDYSGEGNCRTDLSLPGVQQQLADAVLKANPRTAVLLFNGRPLVLNKLAETAPAILEMWYPGTEGGRAAARLLFGDANPCGKLSMSFPKSVGQCPIYYNYTNTGRPKTKPEGVRQSFVSTYLDCGNLPLFFFGQGLSYTNFTYRSMVLDKAEMDADSSITVTVTVENTGDRPGKETVQLYLRDLVSSTVRPVQELIAFEKILLQPGEKKDVQFKITEPMLRLWNFQQKFISEPGEFNLSVGYANHMYFTENFRLN